MKCSDWRLAENARKLVIPFGRNRNRNFQVSRKEILRNGTFSSLELEEVVG